MNILRRISTVVVVVANIGTALPAMAQQGDTAYVYEPVPLITGGDSRVTSRQTNVGVRNGTRTVGRPVAVQTKSQTVEITGNGGSMRNISRQTNVDVRNTGRVRMRLNVPR